MAFNSRGILEPVSRASFVTREIWRDAAIYFQANDADSLADVIRRLHEHRDLCRGYATRAYQRARECFTAKRMIDEYVRLYHSLVGARVAVA